MELEPPVPLSSLAGGTEHFLAGFYEAQVYATLAQARLQETLDQIGPPGSWQCDPQAATLTLRGHTFNAEMLGTFGKTEWLWACGNPFLNLPLEVTEISRQVRAEAQELGQPALLAPFVDLEGVGSPHHMAMQVIGHGFASAYYICQFPGSQAVYGIRDHLEPQWPKLYELQRAITNVMAVGMHDGVVSIMHAAQMLDVTFDRTETKLAVFDGDDRLVISHTGDQITNLEANVNISRTS